jgi:hypothetical protein
MHVFVSFTVRLAGDSGTKCKEGIIILRKKEKACWLESGPLSVYSNSDYPDPKDAMQHN